MSQHVIPSLTQKRSELVERIAYHEQEIKKARAKLNAIDTTARLYDPEFNLPLKAGARRKRGRHKFFDHGEGPRLVREFLREHGTGTTTDILNHAATEKGIDFEAIDDAGLNYRVFYEAVIGCLYRMRKKGEVVGTNRDSGVICWGLL